MEKKTVCEIETTGISKFVYRTSAQTVTTTKRKKCWRIRIAAGNGCLCAAMQNKNKQAQNTILCLCIFGRVKVDARRPHRNRIVTPYEFRLFFVFRLLCVFCLFAFSRSVCVNKIQLSELSSVIAAVRGTIDAKSIAFWNAVVNIPHVHLAFHFARFRATRFFFFVLFFGTATCLWNRYFGISRKTSSTESPFDSARNTETHTQTSTRKKTMNYLRAKECN